MSAEISTVPAAEPQAASTVSQAAMQSVMRRQRIQDWFFHKVTMLFALSVLFVLIGIIVSLAMGAWPALKEFGPGFITRVEWDPINDQYGALIAIVGTLGTAGIALLIAFPVSFGIALFLTEICPVWLKRPLGTAIELLAGVPSIIYGMWGLFVFAPLFGDYVQPLLKATLGQLPIVGVLFSGPTMGIGILTAGLILAVMIIPFISSVMRDVFEIVPAVLKESAYGLGCTRWEVVRKIVLPYTKTGVVGGVMLGLGRALGETMAVTFVIGNANKLSASLFAPGNSIASTLANEFGEAATPLHVASLFSLALILFIITFIVLSAAKLMLAGMSRKEGVK
ncbi:phosphate transport system permease protein [Pseudoduganella flava]|uniref:Phosphate transport system permease protein n=2 Tax=Pseudoduganella flava TaxID=871742 RepID=A0A562PK27_9BURK|nr:phosphate ABC transporter permease subunit PstC [Pseudoduganella flava]QGZ42256.1 phosphate ABC transporter permease subunit PstC [Pseudoduganella flava]TWI44794.1 phosphate transport system permease protein [Pseudoduganella flava]